MVGRSGPAGRWQIWSCDDEPSQKERDSKVISRIGKTRQLSRALRLAIPSSRSTRHKVDFQLRTAHD